MDNRLTLGTVHIVEWLRPDDGKPAWELFGEVEPLGIMSVPDVHVHFWRVATRDEFIQLVPKFEEEFRATGRIPLLHVETHGDADGIGVSEAQRIDWLELAELLVAFNRLTRLNLVVILAACEGFWGVQMLQPAREAAAFRGLIGPNRRLSNGQMSSACLAFYQAVFERRDGDAALKAMNDAVDPMEATFWIISAEAAFKIVYKGYLETKCTPEAIEERLDTIMANVTARRRAEGLPGLFSGEIAALREKTSSQLLDHRARFERMRRDFFFIDDFPENDQRFNLTFDDLGT